MRYLLLATGGRNCYRFLGRSSVWSQAGHNLNVEAVVAHPRGLDAPWVPGRATVAAVPGEGGWISASFWKRPVHPRFC